MTVLRDKDRIRKAWDQVTQYLRIKRPQDLDGKTEQQPVSNQVSKKPFWRKTPVLLTLGAAVLIAGAAYGTDQYIKKNTVEYYQVYMNGNSIGTIESQELVEQLVADATAKLKEQHPEYNMVLETGTITYEPESAYKAVPESEATLAKLESMFTSHAVGVELKVDGKVIGIVKDQQTVDEILARIQSKYAPELVAANKNTREVSALSFNGQAEAPSDEAGAESTEEIVPGSQVVEVGFVEEVAADPINIDPSSIVAAEEVYQKLMDGGVKPTQYTVVKGDCIGCIAQKLGISQQVIYENNPWIVDDRLDIGDVLDVTMLAPELTVQTVETLIEVEPIAAPVETKKDDSMRVGQSKVLQQGSDGTQRLTYKITKQNGYMVTEELLNREVLVEPVAKIVAKGTKVVPGEGSGKFAWPVSNYKITSKYGKRWGRQHTGIDLIGDKSILASDAGVVEFVGSKSGTGKTIIIDHKNGYKTLYGHLSSYNVKKGEAVEKKDKLGVMGNTGNSTGVHLHFEIIKNGTKVNPLNYL